MTNWKKNIKRWIRRKLIHYKIYEPRHDRHWVQERYTASFLRGALSLGLENLLCEVVRVTIGCDRGCEIPRQKCGGKNEESLFEFFRGSLSVLTESTADGGGAGGGGGGGGGGVGCGGG